MPVDVSVVGQGGCSSTKVTQMVDVSICWDGNKLVEINLGMKLIEVDLQFEEMETALTAAALAMTTKQRSMDAMMSHTTRMELKRSGLVQMRWTMVDRLVKSAENAQTQSTQDITWSNKVD